MKVAESKQAKHFYEFGPFRLDVTERLLLRNGEPVPLPPKVFDTLLALARHSGRVVEKDELMQMVWPDTFVEENNLNQNVSALRKALGEGAGGQKYIETVPKRGYRFVAVVNEAWEESSGLAPEKLTKPGPAIEEEKEGRGAGVAGSANEGQEGLAPVAFPSRRRRLVPIAVAICTLLAGAVAALSYLWFAGRSARVSPATAPKSIAVLPFKLLGAGGEDEYLGLGMADTLITRLGGINRVIVRPTSAVRKYAGGEQDPAAAGRELGVEAALEGTIRRSGDRVRVTVRLVSARDGSLLWADKFDESFTDIFRVEDSISEKVARSLTPELTGEEKDRLAKRYTENPEAYHLYMIGRYHWSRANPEGWRKAVEYFNRAIEKDPNYTLAYTGLADAYVSLAASALPQTEAMPRAKEAALKALEIDNRLAEVHISLGKVKQLYDWDWTGAERYFLRAIELSPKSTDAHREYGAYLVSMGRHDEGIAEMKLAREIDPLSLLTNFNVGWALHGARRYDEAVEEFRKVLEMDSNFAAAHHFLGLAYKWKGMYEEAIVELRKAVSLSGDSTPAKADLGHAYAVSGRRGEAVKVLAELEELSRRRYVSPYYIAIIHAGFGDKDRAFAWLEKAYEERSRRLSGLRRNPAWDGMRSDPRFASLLRRMDLPQSLAIQ